MLAQGWEQENRTEVSSARVSLSGGDVLVFSMVAPTTMPDGSSALTSDRAYHILRGGVLTTILFSCYPPGPEECLRDADSIMGTLEIGQ